MWIVDKNDYCDVYGTEAIRISGERYDKCIDADISSAYDSTPEGEMPDDLYIQDWKLGTDGVRVGVATTDARLDGTLVDAAMSDRLEFSKFAMAIGSTTANKGGCEPIAIANLEKITNGQTVLHLIMSHPVAHQ